MKREPIKSRFQGCLNCSTVKPEILDLDEDLSIFGILEFKCCGEKPKYYHDGEIAVGFGRKREYKPLTARKLMKLNERQIKRALWVEINLITSTGCFNYEYNKKDGNWYLVGIGHGF